MERRKAVTIPVGLETIVAIVTLVGVIVAAAGLWAVSFNAVVAGALITDLGLFGGGFWLTEVDGYVRLGMFIAAGIVFYALVSLSGMALVEKLTELVEKFISTVLQQIQQAGI